MNDNVAEEHPMERRAFMLLGICFEAALVVLAMGLGWLVAIQPFDMLDVSWKSLCLGLLGVLPMLAFFAVTYQVDFAPFRRIKDFLIEIVGPILLRIRWYDVILLSLLAGVCEELLFRGLLQTWLARWGALVGLIGSNVVFGLVHAITPTYAVLALTMGVYLGWLFQASDSNLTIPIIAHATYDYIAFLVIIAAAKKRAATCEHMDASL